MARAAGVSRSTVSRVLNGGHNVRPGVSIVVNTAISDLGYSVNHSARSLAAGRTGSVAFVVSERQELLFEDPNFGLYVSVLSRSLRASGRQLLVTTARDYDEERSLADYLKGGHVDGVILTLPHSRESLLGWLRAKDIPVVVLGRPFRRQRDFSWVATDDRKASREVVRYLKSKGYLPTATVTGPLDTTSGRDRLAGYKQALGTAFRGDLVVTGDWSLRSGRLAVDELLHRAAPFRAIFVASDLMAVGATLALREAGKRVPQDVAIVGFDDSSAATITDPQLTTVRNPFGDIALKALQILDGLISGELQETAQVVLPAELVIRGSA